MSLVLAIVAGCGGGSDSASLFTAVGLVELSDGVPAGDCYAYLEGTPLGAVCNDSLITIEGIPKGVWTLRVGPAPDFAVEISESRVPVVITDADVNLGTLVLADSGAVTGDAVPLGNVIEPGTIVAIPDTTAITTTENSAFLLPSVPPGEHRVILFDGPSSVSIEGVPVLPRDIATVQFDLAGRLAGQSEIIGEVEGLRVNVDKTVVVNIRDLIGGAIVTSGSLSGNSFQIPVDPGAYLVEVVRGSARAARPALVEGNQRVDAGRFLLVHGVEPPDFMKRDTDGDGIPDVDDRFVDANLVDSDLDGRFDVIDNCPLVINPAQENHDGDKDGDACDEDDDNDTILDVDDNCPGVANTNQADGDNDDDGDSCDNCPQVSNASQANGNANPAGDACDSTPRDVSTGVLTAVTVNDDCSVTFEEMLFLRGGAPCGGAFVVVVFKDVGPHVAGSNYLLSFSVDASAMMSITVRLASMNGTDLVLPMDLTTANTIKSNYVDEWSDPNVTEATESLQFDVTMRLSQGTRVDGSDLMFVIFAPNLGLADLGHPTLTVGAQ